MDIKNAKSLNANTYDFISIGKCISVNQVKNTWGNKNINDNLTFNPVGEKFTSTLKGLTDEEKMNEIIRYFLRTNRVYEIIYEVYNAIGYTVIKALGDRSLRIAEMHKLSEDILGEIYQKYYLDRGKIIEESSCKNYIFGCASWASTNVITPRHYYFMIPALMHEEDSLEIIFEINNNGEISDNDKRVAKRVIKLLRNKLFRTDNYLYIIDIYLVALKLIDDYVKTLNNEMLMRELIQIKYDLAMFKPELTNALLEKRFAFSDDIYICPEIYDYIYESNVFDDDYYKTIIKCYTKDLLKIKNDDYDDIEEQAKIYFYYSMIKSCSLFLKNSLTWEFFDEFIDKEQINLYSIGLLKSIIGSKDDLLKRVKFITLNR